MSILNEVLKGMKCMCGAIIWLDKEHHTNTYCMREQGHPDEGVKGFPGGHNIVNKVPVEKKEASGR